MKVFTIEEPVFKVEPLFVLGCSRSQLAAYLARRGFDVTVDDDRPAAKLAGTMFTFDQAPWRLVWTRDLDVAVALHEVFHLVTHICYDRGIPIRAYDERDDRSDETAAYLFEYFARDVLRRLTRPR